ncbi:TonB-dependent receptor [Croceibacterium mercuriale]|uniref:TonB-dependent receptor n=2 Tax=Croceibacterium mercuriale TaxID=1572751 RepID=A0A0B2C0D9_9SPHN|nr:TonB-dependent receptor [Croceibacterium mercuriale]
MLHKDHGHRRSLMQGASLPVLTALACLLPLPALAQVSPAQTPPAGVPAGPDGPLQSAPEELSQTPQGGGRAGGEIVVTGTRIVTGGFDAPTPTTVLGAEQIAANAQPNIFTTIAQLPSLQGSSGTQVNTFSTSSGQQGLSSFSLRGVGAIRTLTLLDGQRVVGANVTGVPDVSLFPQLLVQRVDVVNGGASASYGSDAVGGVVNFILDNRFEGIKGNVLGGITTYGDDEQILLQLAAGTSLLDDRLHLVTSIEYDDEAGVPGGNYGFELANGRDWFTGYSMINRGVLNDGSPQYIMRDRVQTAGYGKYGLITSGPLTGTGIDAEGNPYQFQFGSPCYGSLCLGGNVAGNVDAGRSLRSAIERLNSYSRVGFEFSPGHEIYATVNLARVRTSNQPVNGANRPGLTIQCDNPFVPQAIKTRCATAGITNFGFGTSNASLGNTRVDTERRQYRYVAGVKGEFGIGERDWTYDLYGTHGINYTDIDVSNIMLNPRFNQAIDVISLNGQPACRSAAARAAGCQPLNIFGDAASQAALDYVVPANGPYQRTRQTQDVVSLSFSGSPFDLWAGPFSVAFGGEYRREFYRVEADPYGAGFANTPPNADYPADPVLNASGNGNWYAGTYKNGRGVYNVKEAFLEANLPLFDSTAIGQANLNGAARVTDYSTSGVVWAWKVGGTWDTPLDGFRIRGVTSRDVRAPNLSELFAAPVTTTLPNFFDPFTNTNVLVIQNSIGNTALTPELARNTTVGFTYNPAFAPNVNLSFDYYNLSIKDVISGLAPADIVQLCFQNVLPETCAAFDLSNSGGSGNFVNVQAFNLASIETRGFDIEASLRLPQPLGLPGSLTLRGLATHVIEYITDTGLPGTIPVDGAGSNSGATPDWKWLMIQSYETDTFSLLVQERWFSDGTYGNQYVVCAPGSCPVSTSQRPTIDYNTLKGAFYVDIGATVNLTDEVTLYGKVDNLFDRDPEPSPIFNNPALYDQIGRVYRAGVRFAF